MLKRIFLLIIALCLNYCVFGQIQENHLVNDILITKVENEELAEVLSLCHLDTSHLNESFEVRLFRVNNGPGNPDLPYCNSSTNFYICNSMCGLPPDIRLFKIGPFFELDSMKFITQSDNQHYILTVRHLISNRSVESLYRIDYESVTPIH